jgi:hypothetical protein
MAGPIQGIKEMPPRLRGMLFMFANSLQRQS